MKTPIELETPLSDHDISKLKIGDIISISGDILTGRDAVLPKIVKLVKEGNLKNTKINLEGNIIFHTAVSSAGVGPTSSNKIEIEESFIPLSDAGIKIHLGKGAISPETIRGLKERNAIFAIIPPVTALLGNQTLEQEVIAYPELGMEALHRLKVKNYQAIVAAANGKSIYDR